MTRDDIIRMVREARLGDLLADGVIHDYELVNFAALVAAAERGACFLSLVAMADTCETRGAKWSILWAAAEAIRARGEP